MEDNDEVPDFREAIGVIPLTPGMPTAAEAIRQERDGLQIRCYSCGCTLPIRGYNSLDDLMIDFIRKGWRVGKTSRLQSRSFWWCPDHVPSNIIEP